LALTSSKHDRIISSLEDRLRDTGDYDLIQATTEYKVHGKCGECDLFAIRGRYALVFEIKSNDKPKSRSKAYHQLNKDYEWITSRFNVERVFKFYASNRGLDWKL